jgi:hypothetical protein
LGLVRESLKQFHYQELVRNHRILQVRDLGHHVPKNKLLQSGGSHGRLWSPGWHLPKRTEFRWCKYAQRRLID